jgi:hypothetical protein
MLSAILLICSRVQAADEVRPWEVFEAVLTSEKDYAHPYVDGLPDDGTPLLRATFTSGNAQYTIAGFWDGGKTWRIPRTG